MTKRRTKRKDCGCWDKVNKALKKEGCCLPVSIFMNVKTQIFDTSQMFFITVERDDPRSRKAKPRIACNFCPICGEDRR